jgi:hypothetical protein
MKSAREAGDPLDLGYKLHQENRKEINRGHERGQVLPLVAACLAVLLGFAAMSVDVAYWEYRQQAQQAATDAAAIGGAQQLVRSGCSNSSAATGAADSDAANNGFTNGTNATITVQNPPASGPYSNNACAVSVQVTTTQASFFARLFGYASGMPETTDAVATASSTSSSCIYLLSTSSWSSFNDATVDAPGCAIAINYSADFNGGTITSPFIGYAGGTPNYGGTTFTEASPVPMLQVTDPCPEIPGCTYLTDNPPAESGCQTVNENGIPTNLKPGCYQNLNLNAATTMAQGLYIISGNFNCNSGFSLTGTGVTIYVASGANPPNFDGGTVNLSPPTPGPGTDYGNVLYYQVPSNTSSINFNGPNVKMSGLVYAPGANSANFDGANGNYVVLVFGSANFNGNTAYDFASPPPSGSIVKQAVLAE